MTAMTLGTTKDYSWENQSLLGVVFEVFTSGVHEPEVDPEDRSASLLSSFPAKNSMKMQNMS